MLHVDPASRLPARAVDEYLERNPIGEIYTSPLGVELAPDTIVQLDVLVLLMHESSVREEMPAREPLGSVSACRALLRHRATSLWR